MTRITKFGSTTVMRASAPPGPALAVRSLKRGRASPRSSTPPSKRSRMAPHRARHPRRIGIAHHRCRHDLLSCGRRGLDAARTAMASRVRRPAPRERCSRRAGGVIMDGSALSRPLVSHRERDVDRTRNGSQSNRLTRAILCRGRAPLSPTRTVRLPRCARAEPPGTLRLLEVLRRHRGFHGSAQTSTR